jgi:septal ring factor EnvC (AmiA/AmiB activator)
MEEPSVAEAVQPPPPAPNRKPLVVLVCVAVVCVLVAVVFAVMHANARSQRDESARRIVELEQQVAQSGQEEIDARDELKLNKLKEEAQKSRTELVTSCAEYTRLYHDMSRDAPGRDKAFRLMYDTCLAL